MSAALRGLVHTWVVTLAMVCGCAGGDPLPGCPQGAQVMTSQGSVLGAPDGETCAFKGIPYAEAPVDELRFSPPEAPDEWSQPRPATSFGAACPQLTLTGEAIGEEDCLTLNVWTPAALVAAEASGEGDVPAGKLKPALVFFHGGGNVRGSSRQAAYGGLHLARAADLVVVTANYRLGPLGYFEHPALRTSAAMNETLMGAQNVALRDQLEVLRWVQNNIASFGGDPSNVTLVGQSAGGRAVCALLQLPEADGLFHKAAIHSAACEFEPLERASAFAQSIAAELSCTSLDCLRAASVGALLNAMPSEPTMASSSRHNIASSVSIDQPSLRAIPLLVGSNADELRPSIPALDTLDAYRQLLTAQLGEKRAEAVVERYFSDATSAPSLREALVAAYTDARYGCQARRTTALPSTLTAETASRFRFLLERPLDDPNQAELGSYHGLDLIYLFGTFTELGYSASPRDRQFSQRLMQHYGAFARSGNPNLGDFDWLPDGTVQAGLRKTSTGSGGDARRWAARLRDTSILAEDPRGENCEFWLDD